MSKRNFVYDKKITYLKKDFFIQTLSLLFLNKIISHSNWPPRLGVENPVNAKFKFTSPGVMARNGNQLWKKDYTFNATQFIQ